MRNYTSEPQGGAVSEKNQNCDISLFNICFYLQAPKAHVHLNTVKTQDTAANNAVLDKRADGRKWEMVWRPSASRVLPVGSLGSTSVEEMKHIDDYTGTQTEHVTYARKSDKAEKGERKLDRRTSSEL